MTRVCSDCDRPMGDDFEHPVEGHCYGLWFADWQSTDCWRIASARYSSPRLGGQARDEADKPAPLAHARRIELPPLRYDYTMRDAEWV